MALASLTLLGAPAVADHVVPGVLHGTEARAADVQVAAVNLIRDASRRSGITPEGAYNAYELSETGPAAEVWIRNRLVDGQTGAGAAMPSERNDGQLGGFPLNADRWVVWYERFTEIPTTNLDRWQVVGPEIHGPNVSAFPQALLMLEVGPDKRRRLNANAGRSTVRYRDIGPIELGRTYAMKMHVRLSAGSDGIIEIWRDGVKVVTLTGATIDQAIAGSYWKEANYRNADINGPMSHDFSSLRIYDGDVSFPAGGSTTPPPSDPTPPPSDPPPPPSDPVPPPPSSPSTTPALAQPVPAGTLQANPTFANGLAGFSSWQGSAAVTTATDGSKVATVSQASGNVFTLGDASPAVAAPAAGAKYRAMAWVRAANSQSVGKVARVYARQMGKQDVIGSPVTLSSAWQQTSVEITANGTTGIDARVGFANAIAGDAMQVGMISTAPATGASPPPSTTPVPPPPASNVIAQDGFEGVLPGQSASPFSVITGAGNRFAAVTAPVRSGAKAASFEQAGTGNQVMLKTTYTGRSNATATASVYISKNILATNHNRSVLRITSGPGSTAGPRHEVGIYREPNGAMHWAIWSVGKNGVYTYAKLGSAPKPGTWQTLKLETQWDRANAAGRLTIDGKEVLSPAAVDMSGVKANNFEVGLNYSNPADKALLVFDDVSLTDGAFSASAAGLDRGKTSKVVLGPLSPGMVGLHAPKRLAAGRHGVVSFTVLSGTRYTVSILKGTKAVSKVSRTAKAGLNRFAIRAPRAAGAYKVSLSFPSGSISAPIRVASHK
jgi:hypothetical protein